MLYIFQMSDNDTPEVPQDEPPKSEISGALGCISHLKDKQNKLDEGDDALDTSDAYGLLTEDEMKATIQSCCNKMCRDGRRIV